MNPILVVNMTRFGDIVLTTPMLQGLKRQNRDRPLAILVNQNNAALCGMLPGIDEQYTLDFSHVRDCMYLEAGGIEKAYAYLKQYFSGLRSHDFREVINVTPHYIGFLSAYLAGRNAQFQLQGSPWVQYYITITRNWNTLPFHLADLFARIAGLPHERILPRLDSSDDAHAFAHEVTGTSAARQNNDIIVLHAGGSTSEKRWPDQYFKTLIDRIAATTTARFLLVGSDDEQRIGRFCAERHAGRVIDMIGKTSPDQLAALIRRGRLMITNDSGPMHVAAAVGTPVVSMHTGMETCFSTGPYQEGSISIEPDISCHPCEHPARCPHRNCRTLITPDIVYEAFVSLYAGERGCNTAALAAASGRAIVYISKFNRFNLMDYLPVSNSGLTFKTVARQLLRSVWSVTLDDPAGDDTGRAVHMAEALIGDMLPSVSAPDTGELVKQWSGTAVQLEQLGKLADSAAREANRMQLLGAHPNRNAPALQTSAKYLERTDDRIFSAGQTLGWFATLTHLFMYQKEVLGGTTISEMAAETRSIYEQLARRSRLLHLVGERALKSLTNVNPQKREVAS